ncbi:unnamed protein product [Cochlearia groenlandica]
MVASSSSASVQSPPYNQVFINFRGELRNSFVSHLERALRIDGINVFIDSKETRGKDITTLFDTIEESKIAIAIFSNLYTESDWCLDELEKIKECVDLGKLTVIPIFFKVKTEDVKQLKGVFGDNFSKLIKLEIGGKIDKWRKALDDVSRKSGYAFTEDSTETESELIDKIVEQVRKVLTNNMERNIYIETASEECDEGYEETAIEAYSHPLFGIKTRLEQLKEKFNPNSERTLTIGLVGMPGIGKTTLTEMLYESFKGKFVRTAFLPDIHKFEEGMLDRSILTRELLKEEANIQKVACRSPKSLNALLLSTKSLVILDNVSERKQIDVLLLDEREWIKEGSLIIITTSDKSVIEGKVDETYEVLRLSGSHSLQCFSYFAGNICNQNGDFMNLSKEFADYAKGNPFALKILGGELNGKKLKHWEETLGKLAKCPNKLLQSVLQLSYNELSEAQKDVFLDVACFFRSGDEYYVRCLIESYDTEIKDLASKFLINISGGRVEMHDLLYAFGKELGSKGFRRLLNHKAFVDSLKKTTGADNNVRGIFLDMFELQKELALDKSTFAEMRSLRYLKFYSSRCHRECELSNETSKRLNLPDELEFTLDELRYLYWLKFPLKKLPKDFNPKNLIDLNLPYSEIEEVWDSVKDAQKLKWVDLSHSSKLRNLSGLLNAESLQTLNLEGCTGLQELPKEMKRMKSLAFLNMRGCTSLRSLPRMNLISLKTLILTNCSSLHEFRVISYNLETLHLDGTPIAQLPTSIVKLQRLIVLNLKDCKDLVEVPESLGKLETLQELVLSRCSKLNTFPIRIENMKRLHIVLLDGTQITNMPNISQCNSSNLLNRGNDISSLRRLCLSRNEMISNLQIDISRLYHLKLLDLKYCKNLTSIPLLPPNLEVLDAHGCEKLKTVALPVAAPLKAMEKKVHSKFIFTNCNNLEQAAKNSITSYAQRKSQLNTLGSYKQGNVSEALLITSFPGSEVPSWFNHRAIGSTLNLNFPPHWCDNRLSTIALSAVVSFPRIKDETNRFSIDCTCEFTNETGTCTRFSCVLGGGWIDPRKIDSDHVFIGYTSSSEVITNHVEESLLSSSRGHRKCVPTKASIVFKVRDGAGEIVNCGLSLVYEEPNHVVVERNRNETSSKGDLSFGDIVVRFLLDVFKFLLIGVVLFLVLGFAKLFY